MPFDGQRAAAGEKEYDFGDEPGEVLVIGGVEYDEPGIVAAVNEPKKEWPVQDNGLTTAQNLIRDGLIRRLGSIGSDMDLEVSDTQLEPTELTIVVPENTSPAWYGREIRRISSYFGTSVNYVMHNDSPAVDATDFEPANHNLTLNTWGETESTPNGYLFQV